MRHFPDRLTLVSLLCVIACIVVPLGCSSKENNVKEDLTRYMDQARLWAAAEAQINNAISSVRQDQFVHDEFVSETLKPAIGVAQQYVEQLESYQPSTPPLYNVHQEYIEAWRAHYFAMASMVDAVEKKDYVQLAKANNDLLEAQRSVSDALADLARLLREARMRPETPPSQPPAPPTEGFEVSPS
jgi:Tfp pilus assembly protein PilP